MFVEIGGPSNNRVAARLRAAGAELPERAARIAEYAARAGAPNADAIAERADRLADQSRIAGASEQYICAQLPVVIAGERRAAELYVFKRKKSTISKDDANIILSLDLPALGHWDALVNVRGRGVSLQMRASSDSAREQISGGTARLHDILSGAGYRLTGARVTTADAQGADGGAVTPLTVCARLPERGGAGIDVVI
jgi:hypothetical protein